MNTLSNPHLLQLGSEIQSNWVHLKIIVRCSRQEQQFIILIIF